MSLYLFLFLAFSFLLAFVFLLAFASTFVIVKIVTVFQGRAKETLPLPYLILDCLPPWANRPFPGNKAGTGRHENGDY
jgi:hypothetical protein